MAWRKATGGCRRASMYSSKMAGGTREHQRAGLSWIGSGARLLHSGATGMTPSSSASRRAASHTRGYHLDHLGRVLTQ
jgi:hypothetical protein